MYQHEGCNSRSRTWPLLITPGVESEDFAPVTLAMGTGPKKIICVSAASSIPWLRLPCPQSAGATLPWRWSGGDGSRPLKPVSPLDRPHQTGLPDSIGQGQEQPGLTMSPSSWELKLCPQLLRNNKKYFLLNMMNTGLWWHNLGKSRKWNKNHCTVFLQPRNYSCQYFGVYCSSLFLWIYIGYSNKDGITLFIQVW